MKTYKGWQEAAQEGPPVSAWAPSGLILGWSYDLASLLHLQPAALPSEIKQLYQSKILEDYTAPVTPPCSRVPGQGANPAGTQQPALFSCLGDRIPSPGLRAARTDTAHCSGAVRPGQHSPNTRVTLHTLWAEQTRSSKPVLSLSS